jgi:uncharacterized protein
MLAQLRMRWEPHFHDFLVQTTQSADAAHDLEHLRRVVANAVLLADAEQAQLAVVLPAAWLHDCVVIPKDSPLRSRASMLAADAADAFLRMIDYPAQYLPEIHHAIAAHSFSARIAPRTIEAKVVQDADRLDSLGAIGLARCLMLGGAMGRRLYDPQAPLPLDRPLDDHRNTIDHFYAKLLHLADQMHTAAGQAEARKRTDFLQEFLRQLNAELQLAGQP